MRKFLPIALMLLSFGMFSQKNPFFVDIGLKGGVGPSFFINQNNWNDANYAFGLAFTPVYGGKIGLNFGNNHSITVDVMSISYRHRSVYQINDASTTIDFGFSALEIPILYRKNSDTGGYMEIGGSFGKRTGIYESGDFSSFNGNENVFEENYNSVIFGFGSYFAEIENVYLTGGFRMGYIFSDVISEAGGRGTTDYYPIQGAYTPEIPVQEYKPTNPFYIQLMIEINYDLGYLINAKCGKRALMLF